MSVRTAKWVVGVCSFFIMWMIWGFDETANIVNNIGWFGMVAAFVAWTESKQARDEARDLRERIHSLVEEIHHHNVPR